MKLLEIKNCSNYSLPAWAFVSFLIVMTFANQGFSDDLQSARTGSNGFNFVAVGDWGCTPNTKETVMEIINRNPELVLGLGDYSYDITANCWLQLVKPFDHKMKITIGNHEYTYQSPSNGSIHLVPSLLEEYMSHFNLSRQFYSFNFQNVHFISMSTETPLNAASDQYKFVSSDLEKAVSNPDIDWIVVFYHGLAYASPAGSITLPVLRDNYHTLFEKYNVDQVLQAHSHNYQRSFPISHNATHPANASITDLDKSTYFDPKGQIFAVVGTGGHSNVHNLQGLRQNTFQFNLMHTGT